MWPCLELDLEALADVDRLRDVSAMSERGKTWWRLVVDWRLIGTWTEDGMSGGSWEKDRGKEGRDDGPDSGQPPGRYSILDCTRKVAYLSSSSLRSQHFPSSPGRGTRPDQLGADCLQRSRIRLPGS